MDEKKMQELIQDEGFMKELVELKTEEEVAKAFEAKGVEISSEEIKALMQEGRKALEDGDLDKISGGLSLGDVKGAVTTAATTAGNFAVDQTVNFIGGAAGMAKTKYDMYKADNMTVAQKLGALSTDVAGGLLVAGICYTAYKGIKKVAGMVGNRDSKKVK